MLIRRIWLLTLFAFSALVIAGCGGGSTPAPPVPSGGFSNASLKGQYAYSMSGKDATTGGYVARIGSFTADGAGNITAGLEDVLNLSLSQSASVVSFTGGTYQIQANGRGQISLQGASGGLRLTIVLQSASVGFLLQTDASATNPTATATGTLHLQTPADFSLAALDNQYVFDFAGVTFVPNAAAPISLVGEFKVNGTGSITGGLMDTNNGNLTPSGSIPITSGAYAMDSTANGAASGRGTLTFSGYTFAFYIVDSTHIVVLEEDALGGTSGNAVAQSGTVPAGNPQFTGSFVYLVGGSSVSTQGPVARAARFTADGNGGLGSISLDENNSGTYTHAGQGSSISNAIYAIDTQNAGSGRGTFSFTASGKTYSAVFYSVSSSAAVVQDTSASVIGDGTLSAQSTGPFALSGLTGNFVFNWSGVQLGVNGGVPFAEDFVGQYALSNSSSGNISGVTDYVELGLSGNLLFTNTALGGTLTVNGDGTANNQYKFAVNGSPSITITFQAYFANPSTVFLVSSDNSRTTAGIIQQQ